MISLDNHHGDRKKKKAVPWLSTVARAVIGIFYILDRGGRCYCFCHDYFLVVAAVVVVLVLILFFIIIMRYFIEDLVEDGTITIEHAKTRD